MQRKRWALYIVLISMIFLLSYLNLENAVFTAKPSTTLNQPLLAIVIDDFGGAEAMA